MTPTAIISYDDTLNDQDALALGRALRDAGARLILAYVRHTTRSERTREALEEHEAVLLLERGARWLGDLDVERRVMVSPSTGGGLAWLAEREQAEIVVFGSDYRTAAGHVSPQRSTHSLLEQGPAAVAIAPAGYRGAADRPLRRIGLLADAADEAALRSAQGLADAFQATLTDEPDGLDLLVVGSRAEAPEGRVMVSSHAARRIENATCPVLVVPRGVAVRFEQPVLV